MSTLGPQFAPVLLSTCGGVLSTIAVTLVRLVQSDGLGFVPFLFPGLARSGSEAALLAPPALVSQSRSYLVILCV
jgi:hypothetical protein